MKFKIFTLMAGVLFTVGLSAQTLIHHLPLSSDANDVVGSLNGTSQGALTYATDPERGDVAVFNGTDVFIDIPSFANGKSAITISVWYKQDFTGEWRCLWQIGKDATEHIRVMPENGCCARNEVVLKAWDADYAWPGVILPTANGDWKHSVITYDGKTIKSYTDGVLQFEAPTRFNHLTSTDVVNKIGKNEYPDFFKGSISDFKVYDGVLNAEQVVDLYVQSDKKTEIVSTLSVKDITATSGTAVALANQDGALHVISQVGGTPAPTIDEVKASTAVFPLTANTPFNYPMTSLAVNTTYDLYFIGKDASDVFQAAVTKVSFKTLADNTIQYQWPLAGDLVEAKGSGKDATIVGGVTFVNDTQRGDVAVLDGVDGYIEIPQFIGGFEEMTIGMWFRMDEERTWSRLFSIGEGGRVGDDGYRDGFWAIPVSDWDASKPYGIEITGKDQAWDKAIANPTLNIGEWHHAAFVFSTDQMVKMYLDGTEIGSVLLPKPIGEVNDIENYLGKSYWGDALFKGAFSDLNILSRALTADEVAKLMNGLPLAVKDGKNISLDAKIFPNPAKGYVTFAATEFSSIEMFNTLGRSVLKLKGGNSVRVNTNRFETGVYLVRFSNNKTAVTKRLVIK